MLELSKREYRIWQSALDSYRKDKAMFEVMSQVSDLARNDFADTVIPLRGQGEYDKKIDCEGFIYARYLLTTYALSWMKAR